MPALKTLFRSPLATFVGRLAARRRARDLTVADAAALLDAFGPAAYGIARDRARDRTTIETGRPAGHWLRVKRETARATRKTVGLSGYEQAGP